MRDPLANLEIDSPDCDELKFKNRSAELAAVLVVTVGMISSMRQRQIHTVTHRRPYWVEYRREPGIRALPFSALPGAGIVPKKRFKIKLL